MTDHLAVELRKILTDLDDGAAGHATAIERLLRLIEICERLHAAPTARAAFEQHLGQHQCGTGDHMSPHYIGGFMKCPEAASLWELLSDHDQILACHHHKVRRL